MKNKKNTFVILLMVIIIILTSCWDSKEFESQTLIKGLGIDFTAEDRIKLTAQLVKPVMTSGENESQEEVTWTESATGYSIFEAARNLVKITGRKPLYSHVSVLIISEELARTGVSPYLDFFNRQPEIRRRTEIVVAKEKEPAEILAASHGLEIIGAKGIEEIIDGESVLGTSFQSDLRGFTMALLNSTTDPVASAIELRKGGPDNESAKRSLLSLIGESPK